VGRLATAGRIAFGKLWDKTKPCLTAGRLATAGQFAFGKLNNKPKPRLTAGFNV